MSAEKGLLRRVSADAMTVEQLLRVWCNVQLQSESAGSRRASIPH